ncbi:unnamed protein product, partial [Adineta ricciae]
MTPIFGCGLYFFSKHVAKETKNELNTYSKAGRIIKEVFSSFRTVLALNGQKFEQKRYESELHATRWCSIRKGAMLGFFVGWLYFITCIIYVIGFLVGSRLIRLHECTTAEIGNILTIVILLVEAITFMSYLAPCFQSLAEACGAATEVFDLINEADIANINEVNIWDENTSERESVDIHGDIEFVNVNFDYPNRNGVSALKNLNLVARAGETTALVGKSGSGKSTCISLLLRYYEPSFGKITVNGRSITEYNVKKLRENIGVVSQEPILFNTSIYENIRYGRENSTRAEIEEAARQATAHDFIMRLPNKYETIVGEGGAQLSGGEKQRVALARTLIKQPGILLLDEATSALDNNSERIVQEALDRACKTRTTIVIAHRLATIQSADRIYVLDNGNVIEQGTHETLMTKEDGEYKQMINMQQMEVIDNYDDDNEEIMIKSQIEEDDKKIFFRSSPLTDNQHAVQSKKASSSTRQSAFLRLLHMNSPEWMLILIGCTMCLIVGVSQMILIVLIPKTVAKLSHCKLAEDSHHIILYSCLLLLLGITVLCVRFCQYTAFAVSGSNLTQRIRTKAIASLLRQEVAYFDQPENSSSAISTRLSSDARAVQHVTGPRLGIICESSIMIVIGLVLGCLFSYKLTLILFICFVIMITVAYLDIYLATRTDERSALSVQQASA